MKRTVENRLKVIEFSACHDCLMYIAYDEVTDCAIPSLVNDVRSSYKGNWGACGDELGFSYRNCEICNSKLGGDRFKIDLVIR